MLHNMLRTHEGSLDRAPYQAGDIAAITNEAAVYVPDKNTEILLPDLTIVFIHMRFVWHITLLVW